MALDVDMRGGGDARRNSTDSGWASRLLLACCFFAGV